MKIKLSDYIADFLVENGIDVGFTVVGGGAMHLNDSFGHKSGLKMYYNHHEQACAISAESYSRYNNKPALVCVTTGPGGINALTGVACAYLDSLPMIVISGQVRYDTTIHYALEKNGAKLRSFGDQEFNITESVKNMTKFATLIKNKNDIRFYLERAYFLATNGRKGPVWIDVPVDIQGSIIDTDELKSYFDSELYIEDKKNIPDTINDSDIYELIELIKKSKRPVIYAGYGIRLSDAYDVFKEVINKLNIPIVTYWNAIDLMENEHPLYVGRGGNMGDRAGNFAVQNSDLLINIGSRLSIRQTGYDYKTFARDAKIVMVDIDKEEFKKPNIKPYKTIWADANKFLTSLNNIIDKEINNKLFENTDWITTCQNWKTKYKVVDDKKYEQKELVNVYAFIDYLSKNLKENSMTVVSNGACCVVGSQSFYIKKNTRFHNNNAIASMGYGLPASIGACISINNKETICLEGDGSIMMNLQELQTIITNKLPIKIFLINNNGYHSIRMTQNNIFTGHTKVGIGEESKDLSFPSYEKIATAFGFKYYKAKNNTEMKNVVDEVLKTEGQLFVEIFTDTNQIFEPKAATKKMEDGSLKSAALEDLAPFLPKDELLSNMFIPLA